MIGDGYATDPKISIFKCLPETSESKRETLESSSQRNGAPRGCVPG